ncbi:MAG: TolC family protein, partial [Planctomycetes bacterium]|nr:TolC family protein [Planctomycetota bacterium]
MRARRLERSSSLEIQTRGAAVASARGSLARISLALASILAASLAGGCSAASEGRAPAADGRRPAGSLDPPGDLARGDPAGGDAARGGAFRGDAPRGDPGGREAARADPAPSGDGIGRPLEPFPPCAWSLKDAQREARRRNPTADRLEARIAAAAAREGQIRSAFYPRLHTSGQYLRLDEEVAFRDPLGTVYVVQDREAYTQVTSLTYNVWDWGETWFAAHAGSLDTQRERVLGRRALQALDFQVARLFFAILETEQEIEVQAASVATLQGALDLARSLRDVGRGTEADVLVVEVSLERGKYHQRWLQDRLDDLRDELRLLLEL